MNAATPAPYVTLDPALSTDGAAHLIELIRSFGRLPMYVAEPIKEGLGAGLTRRHDALMNYVKRRYANGTAESMEQMAARSNLFRGVLAEGTAIYVDDAEDLLYRHEPFLEAARQLTGLPLVVPDMLYANVLLPGQELAIHTDTPEYRGLSKAKVPEWLLVVMHHSGLFEDYRVRIAGGVTFLSPPEEGGAFLLFPDGADGPVQRFGLRDNTSVMLDADELFHGVERVGGADTPAPPIRPGMTLEATEGGWVVRDVKRAKGARSDGQAPEARAGGSDEGRVEQLAVSGVTGDGEDEVVSYGPGEVRLSVQWKAHCFADEAHRRAFADHSDDLDIDTVVDRLLQDLRDRGVLTGDRPDDTELALLLIETYVGFPDA